ncbi:hypothetical protein D3C84_1085530 [compost metagenome]
MAATTVWVPRCNRVSMVWISAVLFWVRPARERTSSATTANPRPCSPARAASMAALRASRLVCSAMPPMTPRMEPICCTSCCMAAMEWAVVSTSVTRAVTLAMA